MQKYVKVEIPENKKQFQKWSLGFSATVLKVVFVLWAVSILFCMFVISYQLFTNGSIEEPVNFMREINATFGTTVVGVLITRVVGNIFEHNNGGIFGTSIGKETEDDSTDSDVFVGGISDSNEPNHRGD